MQAVAPCRCNNVEGRVLLFARVLPYFGAFGRGYLWHGLRFRGSSSCVTRGIELGLC